MAGAVGSGLRLMRTGSDTGAGLLTGAGTGAVGLTTGTGFVGAAGADPFLCRIVSTGVITGAAGLISGAVAGFGLSGMPGLTMVGDVEGRVSRWRFLERPVSNFGVAGTVD